MPLLPSRKVTYHLFTGEGSPFHSAAGNNVIIIHFYVEDYVRLSSFTSDIVPPNIQKGNPLIEAFRKR